MICTISWTSYEIIDVTA